MHTVIFCFHRKKKLEKIFCIFCSSNRIFHWIFEYHIDKRKIHTLHNLYLSITYSTLITLSGELLVKIQIHARLILKLQNIILSVYKKIVPMCITKLPWHINFLLCSWLSKISSLNIVPSDLKWEKLFYFSSKILNILLNLISRKLKNKPIHLLKHKNDEALQTNCWYYR